MEGGVKGEGEVSPYGVDQGMTLSCSLQLSFCHAMKGDLVSRVHVADLSGAFLYIRK